MRGTLPCFNLSIWFVSVLCFVFCICRYTTEAGVRPPGVHHEALLWHGILLETRETVRPPGVHRAAYFWTCRKQQEGILLETCRTWDDMPDMRGRGGRGGVGGV